MWWLLACAAGGESAGDNAGEARWLYEILPCDTVADTGTVVARWEPPEDLLFALWGGWFPNAEDPTLPHQRFAALVMYNNPGEPIDFNCYSLSFTEIEVVYSVPG